MIGLFNENKCKTLGRFALQRLWPVVIETSMQVRCTASRLSQTQGARLVKSEWIVEERAASVNSSRNTSEDQYLHDLQLVFVSHGLITLFRFRHLCARVEQQREGARGSQEESRETHPATERMSKLRHCDYRRYTYSIP